jgi:adenylosuccinate lyase
MISRYSTEEMQNVWSDKTKFDLMLMVELAHLKSLEDRGVIPSGVYDDVQSKVFVDFQAIQKYEKLLHHDIAAFVKTLEEQAGENGRFIHLALTSSDVIDTAYSMQCANTFTYVFAALNQLIDTLYSLEKQNKNVKFIGRTHGKWAEPVKLSNFFASHREEFERCRLHLSRANSEIRIGKTAGPVGEANDFLRDVQFETMSQLGLFTCPSPTQVIPRDIYANFFMNFSQIANAIERLATNIRNMSREEIGELEEYYETSTQQGSSSMPHKKNPIMCENLCGIARMIRHMAYTLHENTVLWDQRDISNSSVERVTAPDISNLTHFSLLRMNKVIKSLKVNEERMKENLEKASKVSNSSQRLTELILSGKNRQEAYEQIKKETQNISNRMLG